MKDQSEILYLVRPDVINDALNALFAASWDAHEPCDFEGQLKHSLTYICAYRGETLVGFVNVAWDGGIHAFLLDTTVHPEARRRGVGTALVARAAAEAKACGMRWLHVDFEPHLKEFYEWCGFRPTQAGLLPLG